MTPPDARSDELARVLVIDPDPGSLRSLARPSEAGAAVAVQPVATLRDGLSELAEQRFGLVLLSLDTPDAERLDALTRIRAIDAEVPVVVVTAGDDPEAALEAIQRGAQDCVPRSDLEGTAGLRVVRHAIERQRIMLEIQEARQREQYLATHDPLTGVPNRALFQDRLAQAIAAASRYGTTLAVLFLDLDEFKPVNDSLGHSAGDRLLQEVAQRIAGIVRKSDTAARIGGDEFGVILSRIAKPSDAARVADNLLERIAEPVRLGRSERCVHASIGIAIFPGDGELADTLVRNADVAMYAAKERGGNRYAFFHRRMRAERPV